MPALLERVARGERITITKHGFPVAQLVPVAPAAPDQLALVDELKRRRAALRLRGLKVRKLRDTGRP